jgi:peptidoglycan hydrolase-like protein with peptidoglycan-binding domain
MSDSATITREQLRTVIIATELGGKEGDSSHFSYAGLGKSTYSFGQMQFDVGKGGRDVRGFLKENGFGDAEIKNLSKHGGLSQKELDALDTKLQAIPQAKIDQFTNDQLDKTISSVGNVIDQVRQINPAMADAIAKDPKLQLGIADYENQFGSVGPQAVGFLAGKSETLDATGITVKAGNPPTREDLQTFIGAGGYGHDQANARGVAGRAEHFNEAMAELKLGPATKAHGHASDKAGSILKQGAHSEAVGELQGQLRDLGYKDHNGNPIKPDNSFGNDTKAAVQAFQSNNGLNPDGVAGPNTLKALKEQEQALSNNRGPYVDPAKAPLLNDPANPDHKLFQQAYDGVKKLDAAQGRTSDQHSENLAGALTVEAKAQGLKRIDTVALSDDGSKAFAAQSVIPGAFKNLAGVETAQAVHIPMEQSTQQMTQVNQNLQQQAQVQAQTQMQNQAPQAPQGPQMGGLGH